MKSIPASHPRVLSRWVVGGVAVPKTTPNNILFLNKINNQNPIVLITHHKHQLCEDHCIIPFAYVKHVCKTNYIVHVC